MGTSNQKAKPKTYRKLKRNREKTEKQNEGKTKSKKRACEDETIYIRNAASRQNTKSLINFDNNRCVFSTFLFLRWDTLVCAKKTVGFLFSCSRSFKIRFLVLCCRFLFFFNHYHKIVIFSLGCCADSS